MPSRRQSNDCSLHWSHKTQFTTMLFWSLYFTMKIGFDIPDWMLCTGRDNPVVGPALSARLKLGRTRLIPLLCVGPPTIERMMQQTNETCASIRSVIGYDAHS